MANWNLVETSDDTFTAALPRQISSLGGAAQIHFATLSTKPAGMTAGEFIII